jgi:hypothetical protein
MEMRASELNVESFNLLDLAEDFQEAWAGPDTIFVPTSCSLRLHLDLTSLYASPKSLK